MDAGAGSVGQCMRFLAGLIAGVLLHAIDPPLFVWALIAYAGFTVNTARCTPPLARGASPRKD